jgi:mRNA-degrading endonuclease toxin of MazEF toxin-antitoxin module
MNRGDVVEVNWPYSDISGTKVRPAVVVQADFLNSLIDDTIFAKITGRKYGIPGTEVELDPALETAAGLSKVCYASCKDFLTRDRGKVGLVIGVLSDTVLRQIEACLKVVLEIP